MLRIISGKMRGVKLQTPSDKMPVRPTGDRVKEAMFSAIQFDIHGNVLDLFAGTGQLGLECLSRGAAHCTFCDHNEESIRIVQENIRRTKTENCTSVLCTDYKRFLKHTCTDTFDLVLIDPPYQTGLSDKALAYLGAGTHLNDCCVVVLECDCAEKKPNTSGVLTLRKRYTYSGVSFLVYTKESKNEQQNSDCPGKF